MKTLGEFYAKRILSLPRKALVKRELESHGSDGIRIEKGLFGWRLCCEREAVECRSEAEARYLKVFVDAEMREIFVPKDEEYLQEILPELEKLKEKIEKIITFYTDTIPRKIRDRVRTEVYLEITKIPVEQKRPLQRATT